MKTIRVMHLFREAVSEFGHAERLAASGKCAKAKRAFGGASTLHKRFLRQIEDKIISASVSQAEDKLKKARRRASVELQASPCKASAAFYGFRK